MTSYAGPGRPGPFVYMDHAATAPLRPEVAAAMERVEWGNPSGLHRVARRAREALEEARARVAEVMAAEKVVFTSGGSEAANLAVSGLARASGGDHVIVSAVEHPAVLEAAAGLEQEGFRLSRAPVDGFGRVDLQALEALLTPQTVLVSVMAANNEIGTVQPVAEIAALLKPRGVLFHCDAVQTGWAPTEVDCVTLSAHKLGGPLGVGCLCLRREVPLAPLIRGGSQESGARAGTENVSGAVGAAEAMTLWSAERAAEGGRLETLRRSLTKRVLAEVPGVRLTGHPEQRLPGLASFWVEGVQGESLVMLLDEEGVAASTGTACSTGTGKPSHVLQAIGLPGAQAVRFSLGRTNGPEDVEIAVRAFKQVVTRLRALAPGAYV